eukprot:373776_1
MGNLNSQTNKKNKYEYKYTGKQSKMLVYGFIRGLELDNYLPSCIFAICYQYFVIDFTFDICSKAVESKEVIKNNGTVLTTKNEDWSGSYINVASRFSLKHGVHIFKLKIISFKWIAIGITTNIDNCLSSEYISHFNGKTYYASIYVDEMSGWNSINVDIENKNKRKEIFKYVTKCGFNDTLTMQINLEEYTLKYFINETFIGKVDVADLQHYYLCVTVRDGTNEQFEII